MTQVAANSGTSAMVTRDGHLYMFGKDSTFCDPHTGHYDLLVYYRILLDSMIATMYICTIVIYGK